MGKSHDDNFNSLSDIVTCIMNKLPYHEHETPSNSIIISSQSTRTRFNHLILATINQCLIQNTHNFRRSNHGIASSDCRFHKIKTSSSKQSQFGCTSCTKTRVI